MKRLLIIPLLIFALNVSAGPIGVERAKELAAKFFNQNATRSTAATVELEWAGSSVDKEATRATAANPDEALLYVFNRTDDKGFVVLSGEDTQAYVIAFSYDNFFDMNNLPESTRYIMSDFCEDLAKARANAPEATRAESLEYDLGVGNVVVDHKTAKWGQGDPYNRECPIWYDSPNRTITGCVATGMAIVMYHHKWPEKGTGTIGGYDSYADAKKYNPPRQLGVKYTTPIKIGESSWSRLSDVYDWNNMLPRYDSGQFNTAQGNAVAALMFDCGTALGMSYGVPGSGSSTSRMPNLYKNNFYYSPSVTYLGAGKTVNGEWVHGDFTREEWLDAVERNLREFGPMNVGISGHSIVYDGYTDKHFIGLNHGWGGSSDGFWNLVPKADGSWYYPNTYAVFYLRPLKEGVSGSFFIIRPSGGNYGLSVRDVSRFKQNEPFTYTLSGLWNLGSSFKGDVALVMCDRDGNFIEKLAGQDGATALANSPYTFVTKELTITQPIKPGYRLRIYVRTSGSDEWTWVRHEQLRINDEIIVCASPEEIASQTSFQYIPNTKTLVLRNRLAMEYDIKNDKDEVVLSGVKKGAGGIEIKGDSYTDPAVTIDLSKLEAGDYTVSLTCGSDPYTFVLTL